MSVRIAGPPVGLHLLPVDGVKLERRAQAILEALEQGESELSLLLVDDSAMSEMNRRHRGREEPTDVLSFSLVEGEGSEHRGRLLGDVVVDVEVAALQAVELGHGLDDEVARLVIHGVLHLLGHDHEEPEEARVMEALEGRLWDALAP